MEIILGSKKRSGPFSTKPQNELEGFLDVTFLIITLLVCVASELISKPICT